DDLGRVDIDASAAGLVADDGEDLPDVRDPVVGEIHRDLHQPAVGKLEAKGFHVWQASGGGANGLRDVLGQLQVGRLQVHVVGDQGNAGAHRRRSGTRLHPGWPFVRPAIGTAQVRDQVVEATSAD